MCLYQIHLHQNGDRLNEYFYPRILSMTEVNYTFSIYNRWGELIFEANDPFDFWDGTYQGVVVQQGVYPWRIVVTSASGDVKDKVVHGHVNVLR